ncbi:PspC domain-containing protein [Gordonia sp. TBRC 11910]|uniref:PspC domain-containing protein n=1 Tax=Gordonia asplenii TaxID=2725283 RepID=A0A848KRQ1_9ACTN|nr:PspC domain-containing protein [Gordonia asplenii]NMO01366.1 PspC domain-containing protein [Gordonia asplenii]
MTADAFSNLPGSTPPAEPRKLYRSRSESWLGGVCGGIAEYFGWDANLVRIAFVASVLLPGPQFLLYLLLWIIIPREPIVPAAAIAPASVDFGKDVGA